MSQFKLLKQKNFLPLFITQFLGALHDNLFKNAIIVLLIFGNTMNEGGAQLMVPMAAGMFVLPYIIFSGLGAELGSRFDKSKLIQKLKIAEIVIAVIGIASIFTGSILLAYLTLFLLGTHSALFAPSKYSILPEHLSDGSLLSGNALLNGGTYIAVLAGTIAGTSLINLNFGQYITSILILLCATIGWYSSTKIPTCKHDASKKVDLNLFRTSIGKIKMIFNLPQANRLQILGCGWFFFLSGFLLMQLPGYVENTLHANEQVLSIILTVFSIGIAIGGLLNVKLLKGRIEATFVPLAAIGMSLACIDWYFASMHVSQHSQTLNIFISNLANWRIILDIGLLSIFGGIYIVPLSTLLQHSTDASMRVDVISAGSIVDALFMCLAAVVAGILIKLGISMPQLILMAGIANLVVSLYIVKLVPKYVLKSFLHLILRGLYRVDVHGIENIAKAGPRAVIICNHVSLLDGPLLAAFLPGSPLFAIDSRMFTWKWLAPLIKLVGSYPIDPTNPYAIKSLINKVKENNHVVIFPEGRLTTTGALMKINYGPGMIAQMSDAPIIPVRIEGVQYSKFSRLKNKILLRNFPKITITVMEPVYISNSKKNERIQLSNTIYDLMENTQFKTSDCQKTLFDALLLSCNINGKNTPLIEDVDGNSMNCKRLVNVSKILGRKLQSYTEFAENVGLLLPNSNATVAAFFALQAFGRVSAMLNFSLGANALLSACNVAGIRNIVTSRKFIEVAKLEHVVEKLSKVANIIYLEDVSKNIKWHDKLANIFIGKNEYKKLKVNPSDIALVLFTSGSEGTPKGVALSHQNLLSNIKQLESRIDFNQQDIIFNCLPLFHSFGITAGLLLPLLNGIKTFLYPSPLHYKTIPSSIYFSDATIMFGTDTFLSAYGRVANPYDFYKMRYIFAGAERVKTETKNIYMEKFGIRIFEGYGATETSPVISVNSPQFNRNGSVGKFLPGIEYKTVNVPGVNIGARLFVRGPNVMVGYYTDLQPGICQPLQSNWYDTGDIVSIDEDGFVKIEGRAKRFAKVAGEMVSLTFVEGFINQLWPETDNIVVSIADDRKGEKLFLITNNHNSSREAIIKYADEHHISNLNVPSEIYKVSEIPVLSSGKVDYIGAKEMVVEYAEQTLIEL